MSKKIQYWINSLSNGLYNGLRNSLNDSLNDSLVKLLPNRCPICQINQLPPEALTGTCNDCAAFLPFIQQSCPQCATPISHVVSRQNFSNTDLDTDINPDLSQRINANHSLLCGSCLNQAPAFDFSFAALHYQPPISALILELKFTAKTRLAKTLAKIFYQHCLASSPFARPDILIPVPLHPHRLKSRGFNQSQLLAEALSKLMHIPVDKHLLIKSKQTPTQSKLTRAKRLKNLTNSFEINTHSTQRQANKQLIYQHVGLVDDVMTTGATVQELARLLKKNGVNTVSVYAIART